MVEIALNEVSVVFPGERPEDTVTALDRLTLHVRSGELLTLVGPSGSGKSTLLRAIAGVEDVSTGTIAIGDRIVNDLTPRERDIALVAQYDTLLPHLTVEQNLGFPLSLRKVSADETTRRVRAEARALGLWPKLRRRPRQLSSGERQKAALGRATTRRPQVYLFDEPLAALDAGERGRVRRELRQVQRGMGITAIYATHDQRDAMALGDRVAVLSRGRIIQVDEPMRVWASPADLFVARFFGDPPLGLVQGPLHDDGSTAWIEVSGAALRLHERQRAAVARRGTGFEIAVGLRADGVRIDDDEHAHGAWHRRLPAVVSAVEPTGASTTVTLVPGQTSGDGPSRLFASVAPTRHVERGAQVTATIDLQRSFVFDVLTGERLHSAQHDTT